MRQFVILIASIHFFAMTATAQTTQGIPTPMATHTIAIMAITAAFLAWAASYSLQLMKERTGKKDMEVLVRRREAVLDSIAELEMSHESGTISEDRYKRRSKELRSELARVLERLKIAQTVSKNPA